MEWRETRINVLAALIVHLAKMEEKNFIVGSKTLSSNLCCATKLLENAAKYLIPKCLTKIKKNIFDKNDRFYRC